MVTFTNFVLLIPTRLSPSHQAHQSPDLAARRHSIGSSYQVRGFVSDPEFGWTRSKGSLIFCQR
jgi:hypothetical protein